MKVNITNINVIIKSFIIILATTVQSTILQFQIYKIWWLQYFHFYHYYYSMHKYEFLRVQFERLTIIVKLKHCQTSSHILWKSFSHSDFVVLTFGRNHRIFPRLWSIHENNICSPWHATNLNDKLSNWLSDSFAVSLG